MNNPDDIKFDRALIEKARQHLAAMTPEQLKAYSEYIAKQANSTPEKTLMILQAIPKAWKPLAQQSKEQAE